MGLIHLGGGEKGRGDRMTINNVIKTLKGAYSLLLQCHVRFEDLQNYKEASNMAIEALEKQVPNKPVKGNERVFACKEEWYDDFRCPNCGEKVYEEDYEGYSMALYPACSCGQAIDWSDET